MALTPDQQAVLDSLLAEQAKPEPRTETGLAGILHAVLDVASGAVPHLAADAWAALHTRVEGLLGEQPAEQAAEQPAEQEQASPPSPGKAGPGKASSGKS